MDVIIYNGKSIIDFVNNYYYGSRNNKHIGLKFYVKDYSKYNIYIYINLYDAIHYGVRLESKDKEGVVIKDKDLKKELRKLFGNGNAIADSDLSWVVCYYYDPRYEEKGIDFNKFNDCATSLVNDDEMESIVNAITKHIDKLIGVIP